MFALSLGPAQARFLIFFEARARPVQVSNSAYQKTPFHYIFFCGNFISGFLLSSLEIQVFNIYCYLSSETHSVQNEIKICNITNFVM